DAGAAFIVSPGLDADTVVEAHARGVPAMPGALTPTEVIAAWNLGADLVKVFPVSAVGGAPYLRALRGPLPAVKLLPTGGITAANVGEYLAAGAAAVGVGSELVDAKALAEGRDTVVTDRARALRAAVQPRAAVKPPPRLGRRHRHVVELGHAVVDRQPDPAVGHRRIGDRRRAGLGEDRHTV